MTTDRKYKIKIDDPGVSIEGDVDKSIGDQIAYMVLTGAAAPTAPAPTMRTGGSTDESVLINDNNGATPAKPMALREFLNECKPKRVIDKIAAIGLYKKRFEKTDTFKRDSLVEAFESAAEPVPKNISRDLRSACKSGWIAVKSGTTDVYYVTSTGETVVDQKFPKEAVKKAKSAAPSPRGKKSAGGNK